jgi:bacteriocin-like protein
MSVGKKKAVEKDQETVTENAELSDKELAKVSGGRITNIRVNANGVTGGGPIPANAVQNP